ncbi:MAG: hypothetical protein R2856_03490 [Caldilineaceae bacterium]
MRDTPGVFVDLDYGMLIDRFKKGEFAFFVDGPWSSAELQDARATPWASPACHADPSARRALAQRRRGDAQPRLLAYAATPGPAPGPAPGQPRKRRCPGAHSPAHPRPDRRAAGRSHPGFGFLAQAGDAVPLTNRPELDEVWGYTGDMILKVLNDVMPLPTPSSKPVR